jgi:hypothetical protein
MKRSRFSFAKPSIMSGVARLFGFGGPLNSYNNSELDDACSIWEHWKMAGEDMQTTLADYQKSGNRN